MLVLHKALEPHILHGAAFNLQSSSLVMCLVKELPKWLLVGLYR